MEKLKIYNLWLSFLSTVNTFHGGHYRPKADFQQKVNDISYELFYEKTAEAERSQEARDSLFFLLKSEPVKTKQGRGDFMVVDTPTDYARFAGMHFFYTKEDEKVCDEVEEGKVDYSTMKRSNVVLVDNQKWNSCLEHETKKPTIKKPKATFIEGSFMVAPSGISTVGFDYYVKPEEAVFSYETTPADRVTGKGGDIVFKKENSKDLQWPEVMKNEFIIRLGRAYGIFTRDQFIANNFQK